MLVMQLADVWVYPRFLNEAAATEDPVLRMKLVIAWFIAGVWPIVAWSQPICNVTLPESISPLSRNRICSLAAPLRLNNAAHMRMIVRHP